MRATRIAVLLAMIAALGLPPAAAQEPVPEGISFNESPGCGDLDGFRGPLASKVGLLEMTERIYGPWADFYGRTVASVHSQLVPFQLPGQSKTLYVHERVYPALQTVLANLAAEASQGNTYTITSNSWSWSRYTIPPTRRLSFHAVGAAIDVNSTTNPYRADNVLITNMPGWFVDSWTSAGWCWGGDWQSIKDPMHYSWKGPVHTPGYEMPPPQPPLVSPTPFSAEVAYDVGLEPSASESQRHFVVDLDRDGAVDVARVEPAGSGLMQIVASFARYRYLWSDWFATTPVAVTDPDAETALADLTRDGRPDLVFLLDDGGITTLEVFELIQGGLAQPVTIPTALPWVPGSTHLFDDLDRDGNTDLFVIRPGDPATLQVWLGPGYAGTVVDTPLAVGSTGTQFALGDRDFDGVPDLFALLEDGTLHIHTAAAGFSTPSVLATGVDPTGERLFAEDLDGDGHPDLMLVDGDGQLRLRRGGASTHRPGIWFVSATHATQRIAGSNRYGTAAAASRSLHTDPSSVDTVIVATGAAFPDALAGAAMAAHLGAPLLLVAPNALPPETADELSRLDPSTIVILGGPSAISAEVEGELAAHGTVVRLAGADRFATAAEISQHAYPDGADTVVVATGEAFADALSAGPAAARLGGPVLLTAGNRLPVATRDEILRLGPSQVLVIGGEAVVSEAVLDEITALAPATRVAGHDRYTTAIETSRLAFPDGTDRVYVATGLAFPDALSGASAGAYRGAPILLIPGSTIPDAVIDEIMRLGARRIFIVGGTSVVTLTSEAALSMAGF